MSKINYFLAFKCFFPKTPQSFYSYMIIHFFKIKRGYEPLNPENERYENEEVTVIVKYHDFADLLVILSGRIRAFNVP